MSVDAALHVCYNGDAACVQCLEYASKHGLADASLLQEIAMAHLKRGNYHDAIPLLRKAAALAPIPTYELHVALGEALLAVNESEAARTQWAVAESLADAGSDAAALARRALAAIDAALGGEPTAGAVPPAALPVAVDA